MKQKFCFSMGQIQLGSLSYHVWSNFSQTPMKGSSLPYSRHVTKVNNFPGITPHLTSFLHTLFESQFTQLGMQLIKLAQLCSLPWLANVTSFISDISVAKLQSTSLPISVESSAVQVEVNHKAGRTRTLKERSEYRF